MVEFYEATDRGVTIYVNGEPVIMATKSADITELVKQAVTGKLLLPTIPPRPITNHLWLLRFGSEALNSAHAVMVRELRNRPETEEILTGPGY